MLFWVIEWQRAVLFVLLYSDVKNIKLTMSHTIGQYLPYEHYKITWPNFIEYEWTNSEKKKKIIKRYYKICRVEMDYAIYNNNLCLHTKLLVYWTVKHGRYFPKEQNL